jgi:hypothetical protein
MAKEINIVGIRYDARGLRSQALGKRRGDLGILEVETAHAGAAREHPVVIAGRAADRGGRVTAELEALLEEHGRSHAP